MELVQTFWVGNPISKIETLCFESFLQNGHDVHLYTYGELDNVPDGVKQIDANEIIPEDDVFTAHGGSYGAFSDLFRHKLLHEKGGWWVDTDVVCLKPLDFKGEVFLCGEDNAIISAGVLKLPKRNIISKEILKNFENPLERFPHLKHISNGETKSHKGNWNIELFKKTEWGELGGPMAITNIYEENDMTYEKSPVETFYPVHWRSWWAVFYDPELNEKMDWSRTYGIHLWNGMMGYRYFDAESPFPKGTVIEELKQRYGIE